MYIFLSYIDMKEVGLELNMRIYVGGVGVGGRHKKLTREDSLLYFSSIIRCYLIRALLFMSFSGLSFHIGFFAV